MEFKEAKEILLKDIRGIENKEVRIFFGENTYTIHELIDEIEKESEFGKKQVELYIRTIETIKKIRNTKPIKKKRWWKIWG